MPRGSLLNATYRALVSHPQVVAVCRVKSASKLDDFRDKIVVVPGPTNDEDVVGRAVAGCDGVLTVLAPWGRQQYSSGTARAVITHAEPGARLIFSCGWHVTKDGKGEPENPATPRLTPTYKSLAC